MRTYVVLLVILGITLISPGSADTPPDCGHFVGKWHNEYTVKVNLEINSACDFTVDAKGMGAKGEASGRASFFSGKLYIPLRHFNGDEVGHFLLARSGNNLEGTGRYGWIPFPITLVPVLSFSRL